MKTNVIAAVMGALLVLTGAGCGNARLAGVDADAPVVVEPAPTSVADQGPAAQLPTPAQQLGPATQIAVDERLDLPTFVSDGLLATLRLRGQNPGDLKWAGMRVADVRITTKDGRELALNQPDKKVMNLAWDQNAWSLGTFVLPTGVNTADVAVTLDSYGGFEGASGAGAIDASHVTTLRFSVTRNLLAQRGHAVVLLDLARSLVPDGEENLALVPQISVRY